MSENTLSPKQLTALEALLGGATNSAAADAAGVNRCTLREWRSQTEFQTAFRHLQVQRAESIRSRFAAMADNALSTVQKILADEANAPALRLRAALSVIQAASAPPGHLPARNKSLDTERLFDAAFLVAQRELAYAAPASSAPIDTGTARNAACTCGSGLKYKRCCGVNAPPQPGETRQNPPL